MLTRRALSVLLTASLVNRTALAQGARTIKIGAVYPLTGAAGFIGVPEDKGLRLKVEEINGLGGVNGHKLEVITYDTEGNGTKGVQLLRRLIESDKVDVILGPSTSGESLQAIDIVNEAKVPMIAHGGTEKLVNPPTKYVFSSAPNDRVVLSSLLGWFKSKGYKSIALMSSSDGSGQSGKVVLESLVKEYGLKVATAEEFNRQDPDMTAQVLRAKQSNADVMLVWSILPAPTIIARNAHAIGYDKPIVVGYGAASNELVEKAGPAGEGLYVSSLRLLSPDSLAEQDPARPVALKLFADYQKKYGEAPANFAQHSYDAVLILQDAIKAIKGPVTRESLRDAIEKVEVVGVNGRYRYSPSSHGGLDSSSNPVVMLRRVKGKWQIAS